MCDPNFITDFNLHNNDVNVNIDDFNLKDIDCNNVVNELHSKTKTSDKSKAKEMIPEWSLKENINGNFKLGSLNIRSLCPKIEELQLFVKSYDFDVFSVNETWLDESVNDDEIEIPDYKILRKDRNRNGGGVCFYIKNSIDFIETKDIGNAIESIWFSVKFKDKLIILAPYIDLQILLLCTMITC